MGKCISSCLGLTDTSAGGDRKVSHVFPTQLSVMNNIPASDKNNEHFWYVQDEEEIDKIIDHLDQTIIVDESAVNILNRLIVNLRNQRSKLEVLPSFGSINNFSAVREELEEDSPLNNDRTPKGDSPSKPLRSQTTTNATRISASRLKEDVKQGNLVIDVQKGLFLHSTLLKKYGLEKPYVVVTIYYTEKLRRRPTEQSHSKTIEIRRVETQKAENPIRSDWDEMFEHRFEEDKKVSNYSFGFTLYYTFQADGKSFKIGQEQVFSIGSLLDQHLQTKIIDFKDSELKGTLAKLRVRFQFVHDLDFHKEKLAKDIRMKIERLSKIKEKNPGFDTEKKKTLTRIHSLKRSCSRKDSEVSAGSSTHENDDTQYRLMN